MEQRLVAVKRRLVEHDVRALADRWSMPFNTVMAMVAHNGWNLARAEHDIKLAIGKASWFLNLHGGAPGGGKSAGMPMSAAAQVHSFRFYSTVLDIVEREHCGLVTRCAS